MTELVAFITSNGEAKRVDDMTREELIDTVKMLGRELNEVRESMRRSYRFFSNLQALREEREGR